jgi:hypothetical protein
MRHPLHPKPCKFTDPNCVDHGGSRPVLRSCDRRSVHKTCPLERAETVIYLDEHDFTSELALVALETLLGDAFDRMNPHGKEKTQE